MAGKIYVGIGGWTFDPWRGAFYPDDLTQKRDARIRQRRETDHRNGRQKASPFLAHVLVRLAHWSSSAGL